MVGLFVYSAIITKHPLMTRILILQLTSNPACCGQLSSARVDGIPRSRLYEIGDRVEFMADRDGRPQVFKWMQ